MMIAVADLSRRSRGSRAGRALSCLWAMVLLGWSLPASAQSKEQRADELFRQGQERLQLGLTHEACELLAESHSLDPGLGTLLNLAVCHEREGKTATAHREYAAAAIWAREREEVERERFAHERALALDAEVPKLRIEIAGVPRELHVKLDGRTLEPSEVGSDIAVDPGQHWVAVTAAGKRAWHKSDLQVLPRSRTLVQVVLDEEAPAHLAPSRAHRPPVLGYVAGGVGIAALGAGVALLLRAGALDAESDSQEERAKMVVPHDPVLKTAALDSHESAVASQVMGVVSMGVGALAAGSSLYIFLSSRNVEAPAAGGVRLLPNVGTHRAGLEIKAAF